MKTDEEIEIPQDSTPEEINPKQHSFSISPQTEEVKPRNALTLAVLSDLVYREKDEIVRFLRDGWSFEFSEFIESKESGTQGVLTGKGEDVFLVFRGTETQSLEDILVDLWAWPTGYLHGKVHGGFLFAINSVWSQITKVLDPALKEPKRLWIAGHSLGGALAVLAATKLEDIGRRVEAVYTFGQPRVGDSTFEEHYLPRLKNKYFRFTNHHDAVPQLPLYFMRYRHLGVASYHFDRQGTIQEKSSRTFLRKGYLLKIALYLLIALFVSKSFRTLLWKVFKDRPDDLKTIKPLAAKAAKDTFGKIGKTIATAHAIIGYVERVSNQISRTDT